MPRPNEPPRRQPVLQDVGAVIAACAGARLGPKALAEATGISLPHICEIRKGRRSCSMEYLGRIADACGVPVASLLNPELRNGAPVVTAADSAVRPGAACADCDEPWSVGHRCKKRQSGAAA
jgi:transcriptional regulator with XRE-family HTH domain